MSVVTLPSGPAAAPLSRRSELASLAERMGALQLVRLVMVAVVLLAAAVAPDLAGAPSRRLAPMAAVYALLQVSAELGRRLAGGRGLAVVGAMLLCDGVFITAVLYRTGGPASYLAFLVELHLIAVSLLVSYRTGLKLALWYTMLFGVGHYVHAAGLFSTDHPGRTVLAGFGHTEIFGILAFWLVALATAAFSSLNERELRRSKVELRALAAMSASLTEELRPDRVPVLLLDSVLTTFGMRRGAMVVTSDGRLDITVMTGRRVTAESSGPWEWPDAVAELASTRRAPVLCRSLGPASPVLLRALPGARNVIVLPLLAEGDALGVVALERGGHTAGVHTRRLEVLSQFAAHATLALRNAHLHSEVRRLATTDALTGLRNRRVFEESLDREVARAARRDSPLALILFDIDHFKAVNDTRGHQAGDDVLRRVGAAMRQQARAADVAARFGGEEFVLLAPDCDERRALALAERVRQAIASANPEAPVTASAGVAVGHGALADRDGLIRAADRALYRSKRDGRNRTTLGAPGDRGRNGSGRSPAGPATVRLAQLTAPGAALPHP